MSKVILPGEKGKRGPGARVWNLEIYYILLLLLLAPAPFGRAFTVDARQVPSAAMNKPVPADIILPDSYPKSSEAFPVLYLLHGAGDNQTKWLNSTSIGALADQYGIVVVCPNAEMSWYFDSPENPALRYETFISRELVHYIDSHYRTLANRRQRAIAGNSMGGHGALFLAIRHQDVFGVAVSLSGGVDFRPFPDKWKLKDVLGTIQEHPQRWNELTVLHQATTLKDGDLAISFECGTSDFFIAVNRALHQELLDEKVSHDYAERPGSHGWPYWANAIKFQMLYISEHFKHPQPAPAHP